MSVYASAYMTPPTGPAGGKAGYAPAPTGPAGGKAGYAPAPTGLAGGKASSASATGGGKGWYSKGATGAPTTYAPPATASGGAPAFNYSGLGDRGWPSAEQLVASVPVRPFEFSQPPQKVSLGNRSGLLEHRGVVPKPYAVGQDAEFLLLKGAVSDSQVAEILATGSKILGAAIGSGKCREPDSTDGRPRFATEFISRGENCCDELTHVLRPLVEDTLLPYIRQKYGCPGAALASARFRRFVPEERRFVPPHHEHSAFALLNIGLQDPAVCTGGPFVQGSGRAFLDRKFVPLGRGDALLHRYDLQHGVEVQEGSRYELVLIFKDSEKAVMDGTCPWYAKAAEAGDASAQYGLALAYFGNKDYQNARKWLEKACGEDHPEALYTHGSWLWEPPSESGLQVDTARALQLLRRAAELGHGRSQSFLGGMLASGVKGRVQQDIWEGKRLLRLAFEQDDPDAAFHLGQALLQEGDRDGATKLLAACAKGHPRACFQASEMYREGQYQFPKDIPQSLAYIKWSAHQGDPQALSNLGHVLINGMGVIRDDAKAVRLFRQAAKLGAMEGQLNYGLALLRGNGGTKVDYQEALAWAQKAAAQGHSLAHQQLPMFFNAAKNPNPPARSLPSSRDELARLGVKDLRELLHSEGIDFSDCVEKADLIARAAQCLPGEAEIWDPAPEHTLLLEPLRKTKAELLKVHGAASQPSSPTKSAPANTTSPASNGVHASDPTSASAKGVPAATSQDGPVTSSWATGKGVPTVAPSLAAARGAPVAASSSTAGKGMPTGAPSLVTAKGAPAAASSQATGKGMATAVPSLVTAKGTPAAASSPATGKGMPTAAPSLAMAKGNPAAASSPATGKGAPAFASNQVPARCSTVYGTTAGHGKGIPGGAAASTAPVPAASKAAPSAYLQQDEEVIEFDIVD